MTLALATGWPPDAIRRLTLAETLALVEQLGERAQRQATRARRRRRS